MKKFRNTVRPALASTLLLLFLIAVCMLLSFIIVLPLWKWASSSPSTYTYAVLLLASALLVFKAVTFIRKKGFTVFLRRTLKTLSVLLAVILPLFMLSKGSRVWALILFLVSVLLYAGVCVVFKKIQQD